MGGCGSGERRGWAVTAVVEEERWTSGEVVSGKLVERIGGSVKELCEYKGLLKGKGGVLAQWGKQADEQLALVHAGMNELAHMTKQVEKRQVFLNVFTFKAGAYWQLRWRLSNWKHVVWADVDELLPGMPPTLAQWYREINAVAQLLNAKEMTLRCEYREMDKYLERT